jgi:hypothetical protein
MPSAGVKTLRFEEAMLFLEQTEGAFFAAEDSSLDSSPPGKKFC